MIYRKLTIGLTAFFLPLALGGCGVFDWATQNMPVIGQRCENWQCFTEGGQQQSHINAEQRMHPAENPVPAPANVGTTTPASTQAQPTAAPAQPVAPAMPEEGAYKYVPRTPAAPGSTPFEGQIAPIQ